MRGFTDGKLVLETTEKRNPATAKVPQAFASATRITASHDVAVRVVNAGVQPLEADICRRGAGQVGPMETVIEISGEPTSVNTSGPRLRSASKLEALTNVSASFNRAFPPHSFPRIRFPTKKHE